MEKSRDSVDSMNLFHNFFLVGKPSQNKQKISLRYMCEAIMSNKHCVRIFIPPAPHDFTVKENESQTMRHNQ